MVAWTIGIIAILATLWGVILWFNPFNLRVWMWAAAGNSVMMATAYSTSLLSVLDMLKVIDFEPLLGVSNAGRIGAIIALISIVVRIANAHNDPLVFHPKEDDE